MRKHSIEAKTRLGQRWSSPCQQNHQTVNQFFRQRPEHRGNLRRCQSASSLARKSSNQFAQLEHKYRLLEQDYKKMVEVFKGKKQIFMRQRKEIERLNYETMKEEKQIERLQDMLRLTQKKDVGLQTDPQIEKSTWRKRIELSNGESDLTSETRCQELPSVVRKSSKAKKTSNNVNKVSLSKISKYNTSLNSQSQKISKFNSPINKKYKFIPTLSFKHN